MFLSSRLLHALASLSYVRARLKLWASSCSFYSTMWQWKLYMSVHNSVCLDPFHRCSLLSLMVCCLSKPTLSIVLWNRGIGSLSSNCDSLLLFFYYFLTISSPFHPGDYFSSLNGSWHDTPLFFPLLFLFILF